MPKRVVAENPNRAVNVLTVKGRRYKAGQTVELPDAVAKAYENAGLVEKPKRKKGGK